PGPCQVSARSVTSRLASPVLASASLTATVADPRPNQPSVVPSSKSLVKTTCSCAEAGNWEMTISDAISPPPPTSVANFLTFMVDPLPGVSCLKVSAMFRPATGTINGQMVRVKAWWFESDRGRNPAGDRKFRGLARPADSAPRGAPAPAG